MKVHELIEYLNKLPSDADVYLIRNYEDYEGALPDNTPYAEDCETYSEEDPYRVEPLYKEIWFSGDE